MKLKDALQNELTEQELDILVRGYDVVGDIAITIIPQELEAKESIIGDTILRLHKNVKVVVKQVLLPGDVPLSQWQASYGACA